MDSHDETSEKARLSLMDLIYGVILAYGFFYYDNAKEPVHYIRFFLAYTIIIIDFLYVHNKYWDYGYNKGQFVYDLIILFIMSRLIFTSVSNNMPPFLGWLASLFFFYFLWDIVSKRIDNISDHNWNWSIGGDLAATLIFFAFYILSLKLFIQPSVSLNLTLWIVYFFAFATWFKKSKPPTIQSGQ